MKAHQSIVPTLMITFSLLACSNDSFRPEVPEEIIQQPTRTAVLADNVASTIQPIPTQVITTKIPESPDAPSTPQEATKSAPDNPIQNMKLFDIESNQNMLSLSFSASQIHQYIQFDVPREKVLTELILTRYEGDDDIAFFGIKAGCCDIWQADSNIIPNLKAWSHIGPVDIDSNILSYSPNLEDTLTSQYAIDNTDRVYVTLDHGTYILMVQNSNIAGANYQLLFKLSDKSTKRVR